MTRRGESRPGTADRLAGTGAPGTADRLVGSGAEQTLGAPSTGPAQDPLARRTITRGTVLGILDRLDDALERNEQLAAAASSRDLRHLVDDLPL